MWHQFSRGTFLHTNVSEIHVKTWLVWSFKPLKLYYSSKYPYKVQAESYYTYVDLNNEVQFEDFPSKAYWLSKSTTDRPWSCFYDIYYYYLKKWPLVLNKLIAWFKHKEKRLLLHTKNSNALKILIKHNDILA